MPPDRSTATALADTFTEQQIRDYRTTALKVKLEGGAITRNYEGSSFTISRENCEQVIADTNEALAIIAAEAESENREFTTEPSGRGVDFSTRTCS